MKPDEEIIGEVIRIEIEENSNRVFLVFEITNEKYKQSIKSDWIKDIEFKILDKKLIK